MVVPEGLKRTAVLCVLRHRQKLLLLKRWKEPNKDNYTPVGGKLEPFEDPYSAALRETWEETGIKVAAMKYCGVLTETAPNAYNWTSFVYVAEVDFAPAGVCNEGTLEWINFNDVPTIPTPKTDWYIYRYIVEEKPFALNAIYDKDLQLVAMKEEISNAVIL